MELQSYIEKASTLVQALPYIQSFRGKTVVVKYGGSTLTPEGGADTVLRDLVFMEHVGINPVIVHGGGPAIDRRLRERNVESRRVNGLRITDRQTMRVVEEVLSGRSTPGWWRRSMPTGAGSGASRPGRPRCCTCALTWRRRGRAPSTWASWATWSASIRRRCRR